MTVRDAFETSDEQAARGRAARARLPRSGLAAVPALAGPRDPVGAVLAQSATRVAELVPLRHERMAASAFAFYRGSAGVMAADLAAGQHSGLVVQLCGDAHLSNFGVFGSPERRLLFDLNDFDETLPGPFEWDVKRLVASVELAGRHIGASDAVRERACRGAAREYRRTMRGFADERALDVWYARLDARETSTSLDLGLDRTAQRAWRRLTGKAASREHGHAVARLTALREDGTRRFVSDPPLVVPLDDVMPPPEAVRFRAGMAQLVLHWRESLAPDRRHLAAQYRVVDLARKVVGVGSVGTRAWVLLLEGRTPDDLVVLQAKEAQASVLEAHVGASGYRHHGRRVVEGQRLMQAASDIFLGWQTVAGLDGVERDYYVRQLRDWKGSVPVEALRAEALGPYARACAWTLARAHARSGDRAAIAAYLGASARADEAFAEFARTYADQVALDHAAFAAAVGP
ncbi:DUF2252 family protein [Cellulomonas sp. DKR-3]|uniref:DUF2252 family protein n=1 Tax=Cellulomonas fulva TaxID=2835530 RepID=A0ABS5TVX6_9CELL|nr:DUF2252 domain-containing protein [Cellulomonas fulva]MBT0993319.1 DUF2252 family protein [Cellulomonas fulva]